MHWHLFTKTQIESELNTSPHQGLTEAEAKKRLQEFGLNVLPETKPESWWSIFFRQFQNPLIYILVVCAAIIYFLNEVGDSIIILAVLFFNAIIGTIQEGRSQQTLRSLKKLSAVEAEVVRDGQEVILPAELLVPGDVLVLQEGQKISADARVIFSSNLSVDEAALTGESGAVQKTEESLQDANLAASGMRNMVFKGTNVLSGNGRAIVVGTGVNTEIGKISKALLAPETEIPLQKNIKKLSKLIIYAILAISVALFALGLFMGREVGEMFSVVVSLAVSMIPEGLPLVLTLILVTGVWRMSKRKALVKKLQAVEALGQATILAVDKTGTITTNQMVVDKFFVGGKVYKVTGNGYEPKGQVLLGTTPQEKNVDINLSASIAGLANRASVTFIEKEGVYKVAGDPTEAAMNVFAEKLGFPRDTLLEKYKEVAEIPFDYKNKFRAVFYEHSGEVFCAVAGAPEILIKTSEHFLENGQSKKMTASEKTAFQNVLEEFSSEGLRVVAFGFKKLKDHTSPGIEGLTLAGLFGIEDSVRPEAIAAVKLIHQAGLKVVMITGDHKITAKAIAKEAGIFEEGDSVVTGAELSEMNEKDLSAKLKTVSVFARVTPDDKMKIIKAYKRAGLVIAMTGDGVNDAPSLVSADLGVAMGKIGTEVAKEAADIILLDDNLASIVAAIEEGRAMYKNIQKALFFLFSTSLGELFAIVLAIALNLPLPVLAVQILWLNLITDPLIGTALAVTKKEPGLLFEKPGGLPKYFVDKTMLVRFVIITVVMAGGTLYAFNLYRHENLVYAQTTALTLLAVFQWFNGLNATFPNISIFNRQFFTSYSMHLAILGNLGLQLLAVYNPTFQKLLKTTPLRPREWIIIVVLATSIILVEEIRKLVYPRLFFKKIE